MSTIMIDVSRRYRSGCNTGARSDRSIRRECATEASKLRLFCLICQDMTSVIHICIRVPGHSKVTSSVTFAQSDVHHALDATAISPRAAAFKSMAALQVGRPPRAGR